MRLNDYSWQHRGGRAESGLHDVEASPSTLAAAKMRSAAAGPSNAKVLYTACHGMSCCPLSVQFVTRCIDWIRNKQCVMSRVGVVRQLQNEAADDDTSN